MLQLTKQPSFEGTILSCSWHEHDIYLFITIIGQCLGLNVHFVLIESLVYLMVPCLLLFLNVYAVNYK